MSSFPRYGIGHFLNRPTDPVEVALMRFDAMEEPDVEDPHVHTFYEVLWVESGRSEQTIDHVAYTVRPGSLFFISPGQLHRFEAWRPLKGGSLLFTEHFFRQGHADRDTLFALSFLDNLHDSPMLHPGKRAFTEILDTIALLEAETIRADRRDGIVRSYLNVVLEQIQRCVDATATNASPKGHVLLYKHFKQLLDAHFREPFTASDYAERLHVTTHQLNEICKGISGASTTQVIRSRVLLEAKRLLTHSDRTVDSVATELGFFDPSYFARVFRKDTGTTPAAYQKKLHEKYRSS